MQAVSPSTAALSPFVGPLRDEVLGALAALLDLPLEGQRLDQRGADLRLVGGWGELWLRDARPRPGAGFRVDLASLEPAARRRVRAALQSAARPARVARLAQALRAWWPYAALPDEEFRKVSSSPHGPYGTLRLGYRCNQDCWFCWQDRRAPAPPLARYEQWLDELAALGLASVNFTGGEATTWPELPALVARASALGLRPSLQTNAIRLARRDYAQRLVDAGLRAVMVSLHAAEPALSDRMTRAPGTFARTVAGIEQALALGLTVTLTCVVEAANHDHLADHAAFVLARFVDAHPGNPVARVTYAHPTSYFEDGAWQAHQVSFDRLRPHLSRAVALLRDAGVPVQVGGPCGFPVCALEPALVGDPYQVLERTVFTPEELVHRRFAPACEGCAHQPRCFGLRAEYLERFGGEGLVPAR